MAEVRRRPSFVADDGLRSFGVPPAANGGRMRFSGFPQRARTAHEMVARPWSLSKGRPSGSVAFLSIGFFRGFTPG